MSLCLDCQLLPPAKPRRRCYWCQLKKDGTDAECATAVERRNTELKPIDGLFKDGFSTCSDCEWCVPLFYMKTKKRCRGCQLVLNREKRDKKLYGLDDRNVWYTTQNGKCWGCGDKQKFTGLAVHHDHRTGQPYYLACYTCNHLVLGNAQDNPMTLLRLALGVIYPLHDPGNMEKINKIIEEL